MQVIREEKEIQKKGPQSISKESLIESLKFLTENSPKTKESKANKSQRSICQKQAHFQEIVFKKITKDKYGNLWGKIALQNFLEYLWKNKPIQQSHEFSLLNAAARKLDIEQPYVDMRDGHSYFKEEKFLQWCKKLYEAIWKEPNKIFPEFNFKRQGNYLEGNHNASRVRIYKENKGIFHVMIDKKEVSSSISERLQVQEKSTVRYSKSFLKNISSIISIEDHKRNQEAIREDISIKQGKVAEIKRKYNFLEKLGNGFGINIPRNHCRALIAAATLFFNKVKIDKNLRQPDITKYVDIFSKEKNSLMSGELRGVWMIDKKGKKTKVEYPFCIVTRLEIVKAYYPNIEEKNINKEQKDVAVKNFFEVIKEKYYCSFGNFLYKTPLYYLDDITSYNDRIKNMAKIYQLSPSPLFFDGLLENGHFQTIEENIIGRVENSLKKILNKKRIGHSLSSLSLTILCFILINHNHAVWIDGKWHRLSLQDMQARGWFSNRLIKNREWAKIINMVDNVFKAIKFTGHIKKYRFYKQGHKGLNGIFYWVNQPPLIGFLKKTISVIQ